MFCACVLQEGDTFLSNTTRKDYFERETLKSDLQMMFGDGVECVQGLFDHIWRFQISMAAILDFFQRG